MLRNTAYRGGAGRTRRLSQSELDRRTLVRQNHWPVGRGDHFRRWWWGWFHGLKIPCYQRMRRRCGGERVARVIIFVAQRRRGRIDDLRRRERNGIACAVLPLEGQAGEPSRVSGIGIRRGAFAPDGPHPINVAVVQPKDG